MPTRPALHFALVAPMLVVVATLASFTAPTAYGAASRVGRDAADYEQVVLSNRPAFYYRLDEMKGRTAADSSGRGHQAVYRGKPGYVVRP